MSIASHIKIIPPTYHLLKNRTLSLLSQILMTNCDCMTHNCDFEQHFEHHCQM